MQAIKSVTQSYLPTLEVTFLLEEFRKMINDCVRVGLTHKITSVYSLVKISYPYLAKYDLPTYYRLSAISRATVLISNYHKTLKHHPNAKVPFVKRQTLTDFYGFRVKSNNLRIVGAQNKKIYIKLNNHVLRSISGFTVRSVTLTACTLSLAFSKETVVTKPTGLIGLDRNLDNATTANSKGETKVYDLSEVTEVKRKYYITRSRFKRNDVRVRRRIYGKYGRKQHNKVQQFIHATSKAIVTEAQNSNSAIVMENLKGIRKLYKKGNGQGNFYRSRMNSWSFFELQRQIEYKAKWVGIPVIYVPPQKTSSTCAICGSSVTECTERKVYCCQCNKIFDRDENAALNIVKRGVRFAPDGLLSEAMVKESFG